MTKNIAPLPVLPEGSRLIDSHCHLDMQDYTRDIEAVLQRASQNRVAGVVTIGIDCASSQAAVEISRQHPTVRSTIGIHPHDASNMAEGDLDRLADLAVNYRNEVVGYGEIGLDYFKNYSKPEIQRNLFRKQLGLAKELDLPVIIHDRDAHDDCLAIIKDEGPFECGGIMHCFSGDLEFAKKVIDCNFHISIPGIVTFKNARDLHNVARSIPLDRMLIETDGPYLAPVPFRGKRNEPVYTLYIAETIARLRETGFADIADQTTANSCTLFNYDFTTPDPANRNDT